jgi:hypothetical protein
MKATTDVGPDFQDIPTDKPSETARLTVEEVLKDLRAGMRTKEFMQKYGISVPEFESLLKMLLRKGLFRKEEYIKWKSDRPPASEPEPEPKPAAAAPMPAEPEAEPEKPIETMKVAEGSPNVETFILADPEKNHAWALQLFATKREQIKGSSFKANLHGKKYLFVVEELVYRGSVFMLEDQRSSKSTKVKREEAIEFIAKHGWAAYLEQRAFEANFASPVKVRSDKKARLLILLCRHKTYLAALHTPAPAINLYVGASLEKIHSRLDKTVDTSEMDIWADIPEDAS